MAEQSDNDTTQSYVCLTTGTIIDHYRIADKIGAGGMGEVYLAEDTTLKRYVALKLMPAHTASNADMKARFHREALAVAALSHPNIITIFEVGEYRGRPYFTMEHVPGETLRTIIKKGQLSTGEAISLVRQICDGLQEAHGAGVIHRDIKPGNIMIDAKDRLRILDFGLAMVSGEEKLTKSGSTMGTVGYMSPEQVDGANVDHRSDVFSVGVILYEMLTGRRPFEGDSDAAVIRAIATRSPEPLARYKADIPDELQRIIDKALDKNPATRYQHADDLRVDLERVTSLTDFSGRSTRSPRQRRTRRYLLAAAVIVCGAIIAWINWSGQLSREPAEKHLAILPFANLGDIASTQVFCDGLTETLSSLLTQMERFHGSLFVVPASEVRQSEVASARDARRTFGVTHVVTGSVQRQGGNVRLTLNLVDASAERQLRSAVMDESLASISTLQDSLVLELSRMLEIQLQLRDRRSLSAGGTDSPAAYDSYLLARGYLNHYDCDADAASLDSAGRFFTLAAEQDQSYALAYAGLGETYWRKYVLTGNTQWVEPAVSSSRRAAELVPELAPVQVSLGLTYKETGQYDEAIPCFIQALEIDSLCYSALRELALTYERLGNATEAETAFRRAIVLRPYRWGGYYDLALFYYYMGRNQESLKELGEAESRAPKAVNPLNNLGALYINLGERLKASELLQRSLQVAPSYPAYSNLGTLATYEGKPAEAARWYEQALDIDDTDYRVWMNLASAYETMPDRSDQARTAFQRAIELAEPLTEVNPNDAWLLCHLADCYISTGRHEQALAMADQATALAPDNVEILVRIGLAFEEAGRRDDALNLVARAVRQGYPRGQVHDIKELRELLTDSRFDSLVQSE